MLLYAVSSKNAVYAVVTVCYSIMQKYVQIYDDDVCCYSILQK